MAINTPEDIVAVKCPGKETDPRLTDMIELAKFTISENIFGEKYEYALALLVCHFFQLEAQGGGSSSSSGSGSVGGIKSEKEGDLARSFGGVSSNIRESKMFLSQTAAGQELLYLFDACILMPRNRFVSGR